MSARPSAAKQAPLAEEQLALAWRHLQRPHWPATLAAALQHPVYGPCIRGLARSLSRAPVCAPRRAPAAPLRAAAPTRFDAKRAAANDRSEE